MRSTKRYTSHATIRSLHVTIAVFCFAEISIRRSIAAGAYFAIEGMLAIACKIAWN